MGPESQQSKMSSVFSASPPVEWQLIICIAGRMSGAGLSPSALTTDNMLLSASLPLLLFAIAQI